MPPRSSSPICERSLDLTLIGIGRRDIPQCSPKHFRMEVFYRTFSGGQRPSREQERRGGAEIDGVHAYCRAARSGDHGLFPRVPEPILELSPTVRGAGVGRERQGKGEASVPMVRDAVGDLTATAGRGQLSQSRGNDCDAGSTGAGQERYTGGGRNAGSET